MKQNKIDLKNYKYISFDIFDTLVVRNVLKPSDVFLIIENEYNNNNRKKINDFVRIRKLSQKNATNNKDGEEITLLDIYNEMYQYYDAKICDCLKKLEMETEINVCVPNKKIIKEYYKYAIKNNIKIIITSDMYLDENTIKKILDKCNIVYDKLYLSSKLKLRKSTGTIFDFIVNDLNISKSELIHVGDNIISDYLIPKINGIKSILIASNSNNMFYNNKVPKKYKIQYKTLEKFVSNNIDIDKSYYYKMGYETFGPILYGFTKNLQKNLSNEKVFFLSRDGYLMSKAFNIIDNNYASTYFYASRRALIVPTLWMDKDLKSMCEKFYFRDYIVIGNLFNKFGLEKVDYQKHLKKHGFTNETKLKYEDIFMNKKLLALFKEIRPLIYKNSKKEYDNLLLYMKQEHFCNNVVIVDIGWNGNMQMALNKISKNINKNINIKGYYFGILPESKNIGKINMNGYLFDEHKNKNIYICLKVINSIFESMFLAPHGSVKKYKVENGVVIPVLMDYEYKDGKEKHAYEEIQTGALQFIKDFEDSNLKNLLNINVQTSFYNLEKFAYHPTLNDVNKFGNFKFLEDDIIYLAKPKKLLFYLFNPRNFLNDLYVSGWVIGFMKRLTKLNLGYSFVYKKVIEVYLKKRKNK